MKKKIQNIQSNHGTCKYQRDRLWQHTHARHSGLFRTGAVRAIMAFGTPAVSAAISAALCPLLVGLPLVCVLQLDFGFCHKIFFMLARHHVFLRLSGGPALCWANLDCNATVVLTSPRRVFIISLGSDSIWAFRRSTITCSSTVP